MLDSSFGLSRLLLALLAGTCATVTADTNTTQPHIIHILVDDLGFNDVPWHNPFVSMPNVLKLAREGVIMEQSYVQAVCSPTRAALLTGRYPFTIGRQSSALKPLRPTGLTLNATLLPQALKKAGYSTHMVGKWHLGFCKWDYTPTYRGFDSFLGYYLGSEGYYSFSRTVKAKLNNGRLKKVSGYDMRLNTEPFYPLPGSYSTFVYADRAEEIIQSHDSSQPLFLYLPFQAVHGPLQVPKKYIELYSHVQDEDRRLLFAMLTALDDAVGNIVRTLKSSGLYDNSVIVFSSDNGGGMNEGGNNWPLKGHKSTLWEGGTRTPAFIHSPLLKNPGRTHNGLFHVVDWFPTLAGLAGAPVPENVDGVDQFNSLSEGSSPRREKFIYNIADVRGNLKAALRVGDFKLVIGETRGDYWVPPPEIDDSSERRRRKMRSKTSDSSVSKLRLTSGPFFNATDDNSSQEIESKVAQGFNLPMISNYDSDFNEDDGENYLTKFHSAAGDAVNCTGMDRKQCRKNKKQLKNFARFSRVEDFFARGLDMRLYDLARDPYEERDLSGNEPDRVRTLLGELLKELPRAVPSDNPKRVEAGNPIHFGGVWSPGWC